jgi:putative DNA primase/helicase
MPNLSTERGQRAIQPYVQEADLIVLDNLATLAPTGRENETSSWLPLQQWLLELRRQGKSVLMIHHSGKSGQQRGTSAKEDILDTVIALRRPDDYCASEGARFHVFFDKARAVCGDELRPFEARLVARGEGLAWVTQELKDVQQDRIKELDGLGMTVREIAEELGMSKSTVHRLLQGVK